MRGWENPATFPDKVKRLLSPEDRKTLGKSAATAEEVLARGRVKAERDLQNLIDSLLRLKGIVAIRSRMDVATTNNKGTPDFLFAITCVNRWSKWTTHAIALEVKMPSERKKLSEDQTKMRLAMCMEPNAWETYVVESVDEVREILRRHGY